MFRYCFSTSIALLAVLTGPIAGQTPPADPGDLAPAPYWIGVRCAQAEDEEQPIQVMDVIRDAPAARAGLQVGDQIVAVNGEKLKAVEDLVRMIQNGKGDDLRLSVKRNGVGLEVQVLPRRRRAVAYTWPELRPHELAEWIQRQAQSGLNPGVDMTLVNPGVVFESTGPGFPANASLTIQRKGDAPVVLTAERGDEKWSVTDDNIEQLPEDLRPWAQRLLSLANSRSSLIPQLPPDIHLLLPSPMHSFRPARPKDSEQQHAAPDKETTDLHKRLDDLSHQIEALRKAMETRSP